MNVGMVVITCFAIVGLTVLAVYITACIHSIKERKIETQFEAAKLAMSNNGLIARMETADIGACSALDGMEEKRYSEEEAKVYNAGRADGIFASRIDDLMDILLSESEDKE